MYHYKNDFLLDPDVIFLNHGSFGATPRPVFDVYQQWQLRLERQPVQFLGREFNALMAQARQALGEYLNAAPDDLVFIPNATHGANIVARSLPLAAGDEILATDHEYGACDYTWEFVCEKRGAKYVHQAISVPVSSEEEMVEQFWQGITPRTRAIFISHITSPTALRLPVEAICRRARQAGILSIVDAAHSPGQIPLDLQALGADVVFGNCHKWMLAPKGAAFLYVRREVQEKIEPLVVSWGYRPSPEMATGSRFVDVLQWTGTRDPAAALAVPAAIRYMAEHDWETVRRQCHTLVQQTMERICSFTGLEPLYLPDSNFYAQMASIPLPASVDLPWLKTQLYDEYRIEVPLMEWNGQKLIRVSIQAYNTAEDVDVLLHALSRLL